MTPGTGCLGCSLRLALSPEALTPIEAKRPLPPGLKSRFFGDYEILSEIARGGMGVVYRARQLGLHRLVALKMVQSHHLLSDEARLRFRVEIEAVAQLHHPHIVSLYESGEQEGAHYFTMRLVEGGDLAAWLERGRPLRQVIQLLVKVCRAVHYAHQRGILHRDLKPSNILVDEQGEPHVADFGLAKSLDQDSGFTFTSSVLGSPNYMAPEQASGKVRQLTTAVDVYGLGAILYHALAARPPFQACTPIETLRHVVDRDPAPPRSFNPETDVDLETIALKCLRKEPGERYGAAEELAQDLERWLAGEPILARPLGPIAMAWRWSRRHPVATVLATSLMLAVVVIVVGTAVGIVRIRNAEEKTAASLRESLLREAASLRLGGELGHRAKGMELLREAAALEGPADYRTRLRNEVLATMARTDLEFVPLKIGDVANDRGRFALHPWFDAAAFLDDSNHVLLRNLNNPSWTEPLTADRPAGARLGQFSPTGRHMAVWQRDRLQVYSLQPNALRLTVPGTNVVYAFHPKDDAILIQTNANEAVLIDLPTGTERFRWKAPLPRVGGRPSGWRLLAFSPDGRQLAGASETSRIVEVLDAATGGAVQYFTNSAHAIAMCWSRGGGLFAVSTADHRVELWESGGGLLRWRSPPKVAEAVHLAFHPKEDWLVAACADDMVRVIDVSLNRFVFEHAGRAQRIEFSADGTRIGPIYWQGSWGAMQVRRPAEFTGFDLNQPDTRLNEVKFSSDGRIVAAGHVDMVVLSETESGVRLRTKEEWRMSACAFAPASSELLIGVNDGLLRYRLKHSAPGKLSFMPREVLHRGAGWQAFDYSAGGRYFAAYNARSNATFVFDPTLTNSLAEVGPHTDVCSVSVSADGRWVATGSRDDHSVRVWDVTKQALALSVPSGFKPRTCFSPDAKWLVVMDEDQFELRETGSWKISDQVQTNLSARTLGPAGFSPDGRWLAVVSDRFTVSLFSMESRAVAGVLRPPVTATIHSIAFSPDGSQLAAVGVESRISVWHLKPIAATLGDLKLGWQAAVDPLIPSDPP